MGGVIYGIGSNHSFLSVCIIRHHETNRPAPSDDSNENSLLTAVPALAATPPSSLSSSSLPTHPLPSRPNCKVAKVHSWLKNKTLYKCVEEEEEEQEEVKREKARRNGHPYNIPARNTTSLHVHFEDEKENICSCDSEEDAKSISSSHTSGIVMDFVASPKLLESSCTCPRCCPGNSAAEVLSKGRPLEQNDGNQFYRISSKKDVERENLTSDLLSLGLSVQKSSCENGDTVIDQPLYFGTEEESSYLKSFSRCTRATGGLRCDSNLSGR